MEYIGTQDAAGKWGITSARVREFARTGRIEGAVQVGKSWLIPVNAEKPIDGRSRQARQATPEAASKFHLPMYLLQQGRIEAHPEEFTDEEHSLYKAQFLVASCQAEQALEPLTSLARECSNPYVRAGALHDLCLCHLCLGNASQFNYWVNELYAVVLQEERYAKELELLLLNLDSYYKGNDGFLNLPAFDLDEAYGSGVWFFLASCASYVAVLDCMAGRGVSATLPHELNCHMLEKEGCYYGAISVHFNLATICQFGNDEERSRWHFRRAVELSHEHNLLMGVAVYSSYRGADMDMALSEFPDRFAMQVKGAGRKIHAGYQAIVHATSDKTLFSNISAMDFDYVNLAVRGLTNKEIATLKGVSQVTVSKRYSAICAKLSLGSKKELVEFVQRSMERY